MKTEQLEHDVVKQNVRTRYGKIAAQGGSCCTPSCCAGSSEEKTPSHDPKATSRALGYSETELETAPEGANLGLGCGNPQAIASLQPGETVLDLGCGAGFDSFLAARAVGAQGRVIGVDMTPEMISKARSNRNKIDGVEVEFRLGEIEALPVADASVDVILSNCVINLSPDKPQVFREAYRVLKPGGRLAISDVVALAPIPEALRKDWELYTGCVAGASTIESLQAMLAEAGFVNIRISPQEESRVLLENWFPGQQLGSFVASATIEAQKPVLSV